MKLREHLDNKIAPVYRYLRDGEKYSSEGRLHSSFKLVGQFFKYAVTTMPEDDFQTLVKAIRNNPKLKGKIRLVFTTMFGEKRRELSCFSRKRAGLVQVPNSEFIKANRHALYRIMAIEDGEISLIWDRFILNYINSESAMNSLSMDANLDTDVALMNPQIVKTQWLAHLTHRESDALDICKNGFKYGTKDIEKLAYTNKNIKKEDKLGGKLCYAYNALTIGDGQFKSQTPIPRENWMYDDNFDQHAWEHATHFCILFTAPSVEVFHHTDRNHQNIFNADNASNFVLITFSFNQRLWGVNTVDGRIIYADKSLSRLVRWVISNFSQYRQRICWSHAKPI